ncbi:kinase-like domain-containing protein [Xylogone sp. PMI_703]|nr:kinase-like domain-containing protein [Xylogone sp. PMI_703]
MSRDAITAHNVLSIVNNLHPDGLSASFDLNTDIKPLSGKQCSVYAVSFPDGTKWAVRIPVHSSHLHADVISAFIEHEASIIRHLEQGQYAWMPRLVAYSPNFENPIAFPYIILTWIPGNSLQWTDAFPSQRAIRDKILRQIARIMLELAECSQRKGNMCTEAAAYLMDIVDRKLTRVSKGELPGITTESCLVQRKLICQAFPLNEERKHFLVSHEDLDPSNIMVDDDWNIAGIIDWGFARFLPARLAVSIPRFLAVEPTNLDQLTPSSLAECSLDFLRPSPVLEADRQSLISCLSCIISENHRLHSSSGSLSNYILSVWSDHYLDWRRLLFESVTSKGVHIWMANRSWLLAGMKDAPHDFSLDSVYQSID